MLVKALVIASACSRTPQAALSLSPAHRRNLPRPSHLSRTRILSHSSTLRVRCHEGPSTDLPQRQNLMLERLEPVC